MFIFITGNSRSGTTMMSRILGNHADVFTFQELHFFDEQLNGSADIKIDHWSAVKMYARLCSIQRNGYFGNHNPAPFIKEAEKVFGEAVQHKALTVYKSFLINEAAAHSKKIPCEQTPQNIFALDEILKLIPESKVIVMVRDPREVLLSQKFKWKRRRLSGGKIPFFESLRSRINYHPVTISKIWSAAIREGIKYKEDKRVLHVQFEKLLENPAKVITEVCQHLDISFSKAMLDIPVIGSSNKIDSKNEKGIDSNRKGQWNQGGLNDTEIAICEKINKSLMEQLGYERSFKKSNFLMQGWYFLSMPARLILSLLFNLKRLKNPSRLFKKLKG